jgi:hypothetical protein
LWRIPPAVEDPERRSTAPRLITIRPAVRDDRSLRGQDEEIGHGIALKRDA